VERRGGCRSSEGARGLCGGSFAADRTYPHPGSSLKQPTGLFLYTQPSFWFKPKEQRKRSMRMEITNQFNWRSLVAFDFFSPQTNKREQ
jgi:hypothetical protein